MKTLIAALTVMTATICSCGSPNMYVHSRCDSEARFKKTERIMIAPPKDPRPDELAILPEIQNLFREAGFQLVDTVSEADRIVSFEVRQDVDWTNVTQIIPDMTAPINIGSTVHFPGTTTVTENEKGYDMLYLFMYDLERVRHQQQAIIWGSMISTKAESFDTNMKDIIKLAIKQYGKNIRKRERFHPSR